MTEYRLLNEGLQVTPRRSIRDSLFLVLRAAHAMEKAAEHLIDEIQLLERLDPTLARSLGDRRAAALHCVLDIASELAAEMDERLTTSRKDPT